MFTSYSVTSLQSILLTLWSRDPTGIETFLGALIWAGMVIGCIVSWIQQGIDRRREKRSKKEREEKWQKTLEQRRLNGFADSVGFDRV